MLKRYSLQFGFEFKWVDGLVGITEDSRYVVSNKRPMAITDRASANRQFITKDSHLELISDASTEFTASQTISGPLYSSSPS